MTFENLNLHPQILKALDKAGYNKPTQIQLKAIPKILAGFDIRASAQTGTGKTAAFLLPAINQLALPSQKPGKGPRILILAPTRELAMQIASQADKYKEFLPHIKTICVSGGVPYSTHLNKLSRPYDILIATPGRLIDYMDRKLINFSRLEMLILDEADRMLDMGFLEPVEDIVAETPESRQTLLFSATLKGEVIKLSERLLKKPIDISVHAEHEKNVFIEQQLYYVNDRNHKNKLLEHILNDRATLQTIIFSSTKRNADDLVEELLDSGHEVAALHGDMNQRQRTRTIAQLKNGKISVLVATDVAARGIDIQSITHVINYDLPRNIEDYVHRIGRTGRAGAKGIALSFATGRESGLVKRIESFTGHPINVLEIEGLEPKPIVKSDEGPIKRKRGKSSGTGPFSRKNRPKPPEFESKAKKPKFSEFESKARKPKFSEFESKARKPKSYEFEKKSDRPKSSDLGSKPGRPRGREFDFDETRSTKKFKRSEKPSPFGLNARRIKPEGDEPKVKKDRSGGFGPKASRGTQKFKGAGQKPKRNFGAKRRG